MRWATSSPLVSSYVTIATLPTIRSSSDALGLSSVATSQSGATPKVLASGAISTVSVRFSALTSRIVPEKASAFGCSGGRSGTLPALIIEVSAATVATTSIAPN